jgi:tetratricopeptide (TPR) repeat protein
VEFQKAGELDPQGASPHTNLALTLGLQGKHEEATAEFRKAIELAMQLDLRKKDRDTLVSTLNQLAWHLATNRDAKALDPSRAITLAREAARLDPRSENVWNTLGVVQYRAGDWDAARTALEKSMELRRGGDGLAFLFLAMTDWQLGEKTEARQWYDRAVQWIEKSNVWDPDLQRFRAEAAELLGVHKKR